MLTLASQSTFISRYDKKILREKSRPLTISQLSYAKLFVKTSGQSIGASTHTPTKTKPANTIACGSSNEMDWGASVPTELNMARKQFVATDETRLKVRQLAGFAMPHEDIARIIGCTLKTLRKRFHEELDRGVAEANAMIAGSLFRIAKEGNVPAAIFWMKARAGWDDRPPDERARANQPPPITVVISEDDARL